jgi:uncharacterized protein
MPEYLAPGVYVEEVSFRSKSIEGVPTSTTGFAGMTRFGPVWYAGGPTSSEPRLITSFTEFERVYGGLEPMRIATGMADVETDRVPYLAHAARAFFLNGGKRLYVSRVVTPRDAAVGTTPTLLQRLGVATRSVPVGSGFPVANWHARWPGSFGNVLVRVLAVRTKNLAYVDTATGAVQANAVKHGSIVEVQATPPATPPPDGTPPSAGNLYAISIQPNGQQQFIGINGQVATIAPSPLPLIQAVDLRVQVIQGEERVDEYDRVSPFETNVRFIGKILDRNDPEDENAIVWLEIDRAPFRDANPNRGLGYAAALAGALLNTAVANQRLQGGHDGRMALINADRNSLEGRESNPDVVTEKATGLAALGEIDDIAIVALPDGGTYPTLLESQQAADAVIGHAERLRYRIAVVDAPEGSSITEIRQFRSRLDSKYAALYHPWVEILDPLQRPSQGAPPSRMMLPPSGFVTGIYARSDIERGVHKAPANEVVRGLTRFEANINKARQDVLNPEGINALRFFEGRGNRVWGARTVSSDPEWKYVNVRRLFIYMEHSIDKATQWAVFEPNNERLWANIRYAVEDFLYVLWRDGALMGEKPEQAYFVRCDRTTMAQNDLDNGRMICLIGVAPTYPAEFVIFRIGQWTGDAKRN